MGCSVQGNFRPKIKLDGDSTDRCEPCDVSNKSSKLIEEKSLVFQRDGKQYKILVSFVVSPNTSNVFE